MDYYRILKFISESFYYKYITFNLFDEIQNIFFRIKKFENIFLQTSFNYFHICKKITNNHLNQLEF